MREQTGAPPITPAGAAAPEPPRPDPLALTVATAVAELRRAKGLSERAAARLLHTSQTQLRRMEDPRYLPSLRSLSRLAAAYGYRLSVEFKPLSARPAPVAPPEQPKRRTERARPSQPPAAPKARRVRGAARARPRRPAPRRRR